MFSYSERVVTMNEGNAMDSALDAVVNRLKELGLHVDARRRPQGVDRDDDVDLVLSRGGTRQEFAMKLKARATLSDVVRNDRAGAHLLPSMVGAASVSSRSADALRRAGIQYIDASGNAWIHFGDVLIDVRGRRSEHDPSEIRRGRGGNLFSVARAQVAFTLLQWSRSWKKPQREVADAAGVSLGQVNDALKMFRDSGFGPGGHRNDSEFLDLWVASFPSGLGRKLILATYRGSAQDFMRADATDQVFEGGAVVSGEFAAGELLRPEALTIYLEGIDPMLPVRNRWRSDGEANIIVKRKFWRTPPGETDDDEPMVGMRRAPAVLVYADLLASDDPRVRGVAADWRRSHCSI